ncbi:carboxypeptidase-like regulatory domain-containing protein [Flavobacterium sp. SUN046]|uniref:carboxypeptidase-like regulatory domain-containing protein n=1 Tax=Flavobacterium sp. SUN046 TaxID=3002440 RepID=UPI002DBDA057|nr:carboxypeptidase-like regulatory domain-containing protein [Flavobacterium sp. SUN046]MEC4050466.1 carboxypeptidase-like regulatory domain-containing protein [Flavobacterium sp. SUN046]
MNRLQERKLTMYELVYLFLKATNASIIGQMPQMDIAIINLGSNIDKIKELFSNQIVNRVGTTEEKEQIKLNLVNKTYTMARKLEAYAVNSGNREMAKKVKLAFTFLEKLADNAIIANASMIHDNALQIITELAPYSIVATDITDLKTNIDEFNVYLPKPRSEIIDKKEATEALSQLYSETDDLLKNKMDILVGIVQINEPHFYSHYKNSRIIINTGFRTLAVRCQVVDNNNQILPKVTVKIKGTMNRYLTKAKGYFYIKSLPEGTYEFNFSKSGYISKVVSVSVVNNQRTDVKVVLEQ